MAPGEFVALLLAGIGPLLAVAHLLRIPPTLALAGAGLAVGLLPGPPPVALDPDLAITLFLPPIVYAATVRLSPRLLRGMALPGLGVGVAVALATIGAVALLARFLFPGLGWGAALLVGIVAALFDTRLFHEAKGRPHVPRALEEALKAREIASRVVALTALGLATDAVAGGDPPGWGEVPQVAWSLAGGALAGLVIGRLVLWLRDRAGKAPVEIAVSLAAPYLAALAAGWLDLSLVVTLIAAALAVGAGQVDAATGQARSSAEARLAARAFWEEASLLASSILFFFAGLALPEALAGLEAAPPAMLGAAVAAILAAVLAIQWAGSRVAARLPPLSAALATEGGGARGAAAWVMAWASTRSVIGLVAALSVPPALPDGTPTPGRDLVLVLAALVILASVLVQGLTLRLAVRRAGLARGDEAAAEAAHGREAAATARHAAPDAPAEAARRRLAELREGDAIGDETLRKLLVEEDLRERTAEARAAGGSEARTAGAGPPQP